MNQLNNDLTLSIVHRVPAIVWYTDAQNDCVFMNRSWYEFTGQEEGEALGNGWVDALHPEDRERVFAVFVDASKVNSAFSVDCRLRTRDGDYRRMLAIARPVVVGDEFRGFAGTVNDVHDRFMLQKEASEEREKLQRVADGVSILIGYIDKTYHFAFANEQYTKWFGEQPELFMGDYIRRLLGEDEYARREAYVRRVMAGETVRFHTALPHRHLGDRSVDVTYTPDVAEDGEVRGFFVHAVDVTEREEESRRKDDFIAMLGHELRNPLAAIRAATDLIAACKDATDEVGRDSIERAHSVLDRQTAHMSRLMDGLLEISRITRGKISLDLAVVDLREIMRNAAEVHIAGAKDGIVFEFDLDDAPCWVEGDPVRLIQICDNLISNAAKFTEPPGTITLGVRCDGRAVRSTVVDTGRGIEPEALELVFEPFRQEPGGGPSGGGLGLGLALVQALVGLQGGAVAAQSEGRNQGARFEFVFPLAEAPSSPVEELPDEAPTILRGARILLVEDNLDAAEMLSEVLELHGHDVLVARSGNEALTLAARGPVDLVLCDIGLPDFDGLKVVTALRKLPGYDDVAIVALTGYGQASDRANTKKAGFDRHLVKPLDFGLLTQIMADLGFG